MVKLMAEKKFENIKYKSGGDKGNAPEFMYF